VDLGEQPPDAVDQAGGLAGEVVVEADQDFQLSEGLVADVDASVAAPKKYPDELRARAVRLSRESGLLP
jgi:hypothetical protein